MTLLSDGVLAVAQGVPQLDGAVTRAGNNLPVVGRERDGQNVVGVADEAAGGGASGELPKAEGLVPRSGQGVGAIRRDNLCSDPHHQPIAPGVVLQCFPKHDSGFHLEISTYAVRNDVRVTLQRPLRIAVRSLVTGKVPDDQGLVSAAGEEHVGAVKRDM